MSVVRELLKDPDAQKELSMSRLLMLGALVSYAVVFAVWLGAVAGIFLGAWEWERYEGAIVSGGIGLISVLMASVGGYGLNRMGAVLKAHKERNWSE